MFSPVKGFGDAVQEDFKPKLRDLVAQQRRGCRVVVDHCRCVD